MSHITGTVQVLAMPQKFGPGTTLFNPPAAPGGTKLLILHFQNLQFLPGDKLEVKLGYATDTFTAADGPSFWTRPINVYAFLAGVEVTYVAAGAKTGSVELDRYGRGERHAGEDKHPSFSNCDPFYETPAYVEPTYDPWWYCDDPPNWENVAKVADPLDVRARVARSVGMIVSVEKSLDGSVIQVSTCSVTLVDTDKVLTAGHCHSPAEALTSSVVFDYQTLADGKRPSGYNPRFYKVKAVIGHNYEGSSTLDFSLLQLAEAPVGIPSIQMRHDFPGVGEQVFGVHHPNGAVKKLSLPQDQGFATVTGSGPDAINVPKPFHVSGGSSGSGLFDAAGRIVGVLSLGAPCTGSALAYSPTPNILKALEPSPPPPVTRDVIVVFDRSGSMSLDDGTGRKKIDAAHDALSLFVQLIRASTGNRLGLVSFSTSTSAPADFNLAAVTPANKTKLIGPAPFSTGIVGGLAPGGDTSIGSGLDAARAQFPMPGSNPRAILLMTDGLQNTKPWVKDVTDALDGITVHAIGFGGASSLDGDLLTTLADSHGGVYTLAGGALALEKFFSSAFGNIFENGVIFDPELVLAADHDGDPIKFSVCGEDAITAVTGWSDEHTGLFLELTTPSGQTVTSATSGVESAAGRTWAFLRVKLPVGGERDGTWRVRVVRPRGGGEFPPPKPALRYFVNVIPTGGPRLLHRTDKGRYYTGDPINPIVLVRHGDGGWPANMEVRLTVAQPDTGVGNVLSQAPAGGPGSTVDGDTVPSRYARLMAIEQAQGAPIVRYVETDYELSDDTAAIEGSFESGGKVGVVIEDLLRQEGNYTFHARATYGDGCVGTREAVWTLHVDVGIDGGRTTVTSTPLGTVPEASCVRMRITPRDRYGNLLGPGRSDGFEVAPGPGVTLRGSVVDAGGGVYEIDVCGDPGEIDPPTVVLTQPERPPVVVGAAATKLYVYSVKFLCGAQGADCCGCEPCSRGATAPRSTSTTRPRTSRRCSCARSRS